MNIRLPNKRNKVKLKVFTSGGFNPKHTFLYTDKRACNASTPFNQLGRNNFFSLVLQPCQEKLR